MPADGASKAKVKIGFVVLADQHFGHVERLIRRLATDPDDLILLHLDRSAGLAHLKSLQARLTDLVNVSVHQDFRTAWGSFGLVQATAELTKRILAYRPSLDFISIHSGTDYPIRAISSYRQFLAENSKLGFVSLFDSAEQQYGFRSRYELYYPWPYVIRHARARRITMRIQQFLGIKRAPPCELLPAFGWHWWTLPAPIAIWLAEQALAPQIVRFYRRTALPEEMVFQTLLANSHYSGNIRHNYLRFAKSTSSGHWPKWLDMSDLSDIRQSGAFFCRKVVSGSDLGLCDALDRQSEECS